MISRRVNNLDYYYFFFDFYYYYINYYTSGLAFRFCLFGLVVACGAAGIWRGLEGEMSGARPGMSRS